MGPLLLFLYTCPMSYILNNLGPLSIIAILFISGFVIMGYGVFCMIRDAE
jgi:hypothetical protein